MGLRQPFGNDMNRTLTAVELQNARVLLTDIRKRPHDSSGDDFAALVRQADRATKNVPGNVLLAAGWLTNIYLTIMLSLIFNSVVSFARQRELCRLLIKKE